MASERRLIDANALLAEISEDNPRIYLNPYEYVVCSSKIDGELVHKRADVLRAIESAPTVDAVEVVRCRDCRYSTLENGELWCDGPIGIFGTVGLNDFCSRGERKMVNLEDIVDLEAQTKANNDAMRKVIDFMTGGNDNG